MSSPSEILTFPEVRVVEASAGSGKTYRLVKRYLQLLLLSPAISDGALPIRPILAITFTNKAAFEMKARILDFLKKIALKKLSVQQEQELLIPLKLNRDEAAVKASRIMDEIVHHYHFFQVQTIDSFINTLLSGCAFRMGFSANFRIKRNSLEYVQYSLDQLIDDTRRQPKIFKIFEKFLHQYLFLENKTGWFPKEDMLILLAALYQQKNTFGHPFRRYHLEPEDVLVQKRQILSWMRELREQLPAATDQRFLKSLDDFLQRYSQGFDIDRVSDYFAREEIPVCKGGQVSSQAQDLWQNIHHGLRQLSEAEAYSLFNPYIEVFEGMMAHFEEKAKRDDVVFLEELNTRARFLFDEAGITVEEIYYRLATRFRHYLIDEFQDTSRLQWQNLMLMVEEALASGGSLFYVGDKKQAIYRFRGGEVKLFDDIQNDFQHFNIRREQLIKNYRSAENIVQFNNQIFSIENLRRFLQKKSEYDRQKSKKEEVSHLTSEDVQTLEAVFHAAVQEFLPGRGGGYVKVELVDGDLKDERDGVIREKLLLRIRELRGRFTYRDMAILTRNNREVEQLTNWLMQEGIMVESERTVNIRENPLIEDLITLLQFLNSPIDNTAFAKFLLGPVWAKASGLSSEQLQEFLVSLRPRLQEEKDFYIYKAFQQKFPPLWNQYFDEFFRNVGLYPLYEWVVSIISRFQILAHFPDQQGFVMRFLELIKEQEEETTELAAFLEVLEKLPDEHFYVATTESDAVRILTIHKSKGLEFPVVILPFLGMDVQPASGGGLGQQSYLMDFREDHLELLRIKNKYLSFSPRLAEIRRQEYVRSFLSECNSMYVALTRPAQELHIFIPQKIGSHFNLAAFLIPEQLRELGAPTEKCTLTESQEGQEPLRQDLPLSDHQDWIPFLREEFGDLQNLQQYQRLRQGEILHAILARIGNLQSGQEPQMMDQALKQVQSLYPEVKNWSPYRREIEEMIQDKGLRRFFYVAGAHVHCEKEFVSAAGHAKRMDRLIMTDEEIWVVDYKASRELAEQGHYQLQVKEYVQILQGFYSDRRIRGFLIYLKEKQCEEI